MTRWAFFRSSKVQRSAQCSQSLSRHRLNSGYLLSERTRNQPTHAVAQVARVPQHCASCLRACVADSTVANVLQVRWLPRDMHASIGSHIIYPPSPLRGVWPAGGCVNSPRRGGHQLSYETAPLTYLPWSTCCSSCVASRSRTRCRAAPPAAAPCCSSRGARRCSVATALVEGPPATTHPVRAPPSRCGPITFCLSVSLPVQQGVGSSSPSCRVCQRDRKEVDSKLHHSS